MIQDDAYGEAGQAGVDFAAEKLGFEVAETQRYKIGTKDVAGPDLAPALGEVRRGVPRRGRRPTRARSGARRRR